MTTSQGARTSVLSVLLLAAAAWWSWDNWFSLRRPPELCFGTSSGQATGEFTVPLRSPIKLDGFMKEQIYEMRRAIVAERPELVSRYRPDDDIFGEIQDGKPWWGMEGIYFYGPGVMSTQGDSEESRFLFNPHLLIAVREPVAVEGYLPNGATNYDPVPLKLTWNCAGSAARVVYDVSRYFAFIGPRNYTGENARMLWIVAYNARDMGFNYFYIDPLQSKNIGKHDEHYGPVPLVQHVHAGPSCGFPGDCNNMSPVQAATFMQVPELPARAVIKLWRKKPPPVSSRADMTYTIDML